MVNRCPFQAAAVSIHAPSWLPVLSAVHCASEAAFITVSAGAVSPLGLGCRAGGCAGHGRGRLALGNVLDKGREEVGGGGVPPFHESCEATQGANRRPSVLSPTCKRVATATAVRRVTATHYCRSWPIPYSSMACGRVRRSYACSGKRECGVLSLRRVLLNGEIMRAASGAPDNVAGVM